MGLVVDSYRFAAAGGAPASVSYVTNSTTGVDGSSTTYTATSIGTADADRTVVIAVGARFTNSTPSTVTAVTVGGNSASELCQTSSVAGSSQVVAGLFAINVAAGTTADIVVTLSQSAARQGIGVYRCTGIGTTPNDTAISSASDGAGAVDVTAGGAVIGVVANTLNSATSTWTGLIEDFDTQMASEQGYLSGASDEFASAQTVNITATPAVAATPAAAYAAW
jgi:hypothetical protein